MSAETALVVLAVVQMLAVAGLFLLNTGRRGGRSAAQLSDLQEDIAKKAAWKDVYTRAQALERESQLRQVLLDEVHRECVSNRVLDVELKSDRQRLDRLERHVFNGRGVPTT